MLILGMNTKRQRRLNVRLGEIGDVSASISGGSLAQTKLDKQRWEVEQKRAGEWKNSADTQNWENWNPNSKGYDLGLEETDRKNPRMGFGIVNRKRRLKKQRTWSMSSGGISSAWQSWVTPEISNKTEKSYGCGNPNDHLVDTGYGLNYDSCVRDEDASKMNSNDSFPENSCKQDYNSPSDCKLCSDKAGFLKKPQGASTVMYDVKEWLMDLGLGKYADLFEMHEVDAEALPLLTYEDLKEMGITALSTQRRLYSAIRLLNKGSDTT